MYAIYSNIYHQYIPNVSIYTIHGSYVICIPFVPTPVALVVGLQVRTGFASSQGQLLQMIEFSQDKVSPGHIYDDRW